ncbi:hypothetical protein B0H14DRAFT_2613364 [Mycena olivaceomarginata]|nr:hypothetical protein B0H14DRAFT_2613364 [Mycena olivaceomarginata]
MPRGRPRLDTDLKQQHLQDSRKRYEERNVEMRREAANSQTGEHCGLGLLHTVEYRNDAAASSARHRDRKRSQEREERRTANAVKKRASLITLTPAPRCTVPPLNNGHLTAEDLDDSSTDEEPNEDRARCPLEVPMWPMRAAHPKRCPRFEEAALGAPACASVSRLDRARRDFFPMCKYCKGEDCPGCACPPYPGILLCTPIYHQPDPGHEDRWTHPGPFYAVVSEEWRGVVTSMPRPGCGSTGCGTWTAQSTITTKESTRRALRRPSQAPPLSIDANRFYDLASTLTFIAHNCVPRQGQFSRRNAPRNAPKMTKDELDFLASSRPMQGPISPQRLNQQFVIVPNPQVPIGKAPACKAAARIRAWLRTMSRPLSGWEARSHSPTEHEVVEEIIDAHGSTAVMYAVSGHNRVFQNRNRAMAVLQRTPGADLLFTRDENQLFECLAEEVAGKMKI